MSKQILFLAFMLLAFGAAAQTTVNIPQNATTRAEAAIRALLPLPEGEVYQATNPGLKDRDWKTNVSRLQQAVDTIAVFGQMVDAAEAKAAAAETKADSLTKKLVEEMLNGAGKTTPDTNAIKVIKKALDLAFLDRDSLRQIERKAKDAFMNAVVIANALHNQRVVDAIAALKPKKSVYDPLFRGRLEFSQNKFNLDGNSETLYGAEFSLEAGRLRTISAYAAFEARTDFNLNYEERIHPIVFGQSKLVIGANIPLLPLRNIIVSTSGGLGMIANGFQLQNTDYQWQYGVIAQGNLNVKTRWAFLQAGYHRVFYGISPAQNGNSENRDFDGEGWRVNVTGFNKAGIGLGFGQDHVKVPVGEVTTRRLYLTLRF